mgnify:CR=1 FL=1
MSTHPTEAVLGEVHAERVRQDAKWDEQNHPNGTGEGRLSDLTYRNTTAHAAKGLVDGMAKSGRLTYAAILYEEFAEAMEEVDPTRLRAELVQVAAVAVAWVEKIDRETAREKAEQTSGAVPDPAMAFIMGDGVPDALLDAQERAEKERERAKKETKP